jgi:hypothetical protein
MYDETDDFFNNKMGRLFTSLNYKGTNFGESINTKENPDTIKSEPIFQLMLEKNYFDPTTVGKTTPPTPAPLARGDMQISSDFIDFIQKLGAHHATLDEGVGAEDWTTAVRTSEATKKLMNVYTNWPNMTPETREFYMTFFNLVATGTHPTGKKKGDPVVPGPKFSAPEPGQPEFKFLNLKKVDPNNQKSETLFGSTLPYLPKGMVDSTGKTLPTTHLHEIYETELNRGGRKTTIFGGANEMFNAWVNLDVSKFLRNVLYAQSQAPSPSSPVSTPLGSVYDMVTDKLYKVNDKGQVVDAAGNVMDATRLEKDTVENCQGTYLPNCDLVYECLLSGDSKKLAQCLSKLSVKSMYQVAVSEVRKMNPKIIEKILKTFAVETDKYGSIEHYLEWRGNFEGRLVSKMGDRERASKTASAVLGNEKLLEYIKNLMRVLQENPEALGIGADGKALKQSALSDLPALTEKKVRYFIKPQNINRPQALSNQVTSLIQHLNVIPQNFMSNVSVPLGLGNMNFGNPLMGLGPFGMMRGGGVVDETVQTMELIYKDILKELKASGKDLVDKDKKQIEDALAQLKKNNQELSSALNDLKAFLRLNTALTAGITNVRLDDIRDAQKISLESQIKSLQSCVNSTAMNQRTLMETLLSQVFTPMITVASGLSSPGMRLATY